MKKLLRIALSLLLFASPALGQNSAYPVLTGTGSPVGVITCGSLNNGQTYTDNSTALIWTCISPTWHAPFNSASPGPIGGTTPGPISSTASYAVDNFSGTTLGAKIVACYAALPAAGGTCDASGITGAQSFSTDIFSALTGTPAIIKLGPTTITAAVAQNYLDPKVTWIGAGPLATTIQYTATGSIAAVITVGSSGTTVEQGSISNMTITGNSHTTSGVLMRNAARGQYDNLVVGGAATNCFLLQFSVLNKFVNATCSSNVSTFTATPTNGLQIAYDGVLGASSANTFVNPIMEGIGTGVVCDGALNNIITGGASEGNSSYGVNLLATSNPCYELTLDTVDLEANTTADIHLASTTQLTLIDTVYSTLVNNNGVLANVFPGTLTAVSGAGGCDEVGMSQVSGTDALHWKMCTGYNQTNSDLWWLVNGTERFRVDTSGDFCIGYSSTCAGGGYGLDVNGYVNGLVTANHGTSRSVAKQNEIYVCTSTCTITPPTPAEGMQVCVQNDDNVSTVITLAAVTSVLYESTARTAYGTADHTMTSGGAVGDQICLVGRDSTHWNVWSYKGTWTNN